MSLKTIFAAVGILAFVDYIPDGQFDLTGHAINESSDAVTTIVNWGERQLDRLTQ